MSIAARIVAITVLCALCAGCGGIPTFGIGKGGPTTVPNVPRERSVDPDRAIALINDYRKKKGRPPLQVDPALSAIAAETARELARRNKVSTEMHTSEGISKRFAAANYEAVRAAENLGAGYPTLVLVIEGWEKSAGHRRNLLNREFTRAGIGLALTDAGDLKSFWVLLLAKPDEAA